MADKKKEDKGTKPKALKVPSPLLPLTASAKRCVLLTGQVVVSH